MDWDETLVFGNSLYEWARFFGTTLLIWGALFFLRTLITRKARRWIEPLPSGPFRELCIELPKATRGFFLLAVALYFGLRLITLPKLAGILALRTLLLLFTIQVALWGTRSIRSIASLLIRTRTGSDSASTAAIHLIEFGVQLVFYAFLVLHTLKNFGVDITAWVTGLGIGGIAVALAVQNVLGDVLASLTIVLDKPFVIGDSVVVGNYSGTIEKVGLKTTRIRSTSGEQLIFSNSDLLKSTIQNFKRMRERRVQFLLRLSPETSATKLTEIPELIKNAVHSISTIRFERAHFKEIGSYSMDFEIVYWVNEPDFNVYMNAQQDLNLALLTEMERKGVSLYRAPNPNPQPGHSPS